MTFATFTHFVTSRSRMMAAAAVGAAVLLSSAVGSAQTAPTPQPAQQATEEAPPPPPPPQPPQPPQPLRYGEPLVGLTANQLADFMEGREDFRNVETPATGLGPIFNRDSCVACHGVPAIGGSSRIFVTRFGHVANGVFDPLTSLGGSLLQERAISRDGLERVPPQANVIAKRQSTPLFGLGLIEAIPDATILRGVRATPVNGVLGKASMVQDVATGRRLVGRFGWKGQQANLLTFSGDAYLNEMGITSRLFPTENAPNGNVALLTKLDKVRDPEDQVDPANGKGDIDRLADFMRFIAAPPTAPVTASTAFGAKIFLDTGCASCHTPMMMTGPSPVAALNAKAVMLYSDLLLHDMGTLGDGIVQGSAGPRDMKTPPLWGLNVSGPYLHDGRAATIEAAIQAHDGEARIIKDNYLKLNADQKKLLVDFLKSI